MAADADDATVRIPQPHEQMCAGRFPRTRMPHDGDGLPRVDGEGQVVDGSALACLVAEIDSFEFHLWDYGPSRWRSHQVAHRRFGAQHLVDTRSRGSDDIEIAGDVGHR